MDGLYVRIGSAFVDKKTRHYGIYAFYATMLSWEQNFLRFRSQIMKRWINS